MGKGDKRTKKGKIWRKSYGVSRPRVARNQSVTVLSKEEKEAKLAAAAEKEAKKAAKAAASKKEAAKKEPVKKAAPKKEAPKKEETKPVAAAAPAESAAPAKKKSNKPDDLKKIEGIGPKIAETLTAAGIATFSDLSKAEPSKLSEIIAGVRGNHVTDTWPEQAGLAAADKWEELKVLQDELDGGKRK